MRNPLGRSRGLGAYTTEELIDRAHELHHHRVRLLGSRTYLMQYMRGEVPDPLEGYDPDDPWYSYTAIENHLAQRMGGLLDAGP